MPVANPSFHPAKAKPIEERRGGMKKRLPQ